MGTGAAGWIGGLVGGAESVEDVAICALSSGLGLRNW